MERGETLDRFSRAHLASPAELAVYLALDRTIEGSLSAQQISERTGLSIGDVDEVAASFVAAGIFQATSSLGRSAYTRRRAADYLEPGSAGSTTDVDPVCGMRLPGGSAFVEQDADGNQVHFCSARCRAAFIAFPGLFRRAR